MLRSTPAIPIARALHHDFGMLTLERFPSGVGDRFAHQAKAGARRLDLWKASENIVAKQIGGNARERHRLPLFIS